jgi:hypothetical protein
VCASNTTKRGCIPPTSLLRFWKNSSGIYWTIRRTVRTSCPAISTCFFTLKNLSGKKFDDNDEVQKEVLTLFKVLVVYFYDSEIQKLIPGLNKYLGNAREYVEK